MVLFRISIKVEDHEGSKTGLNTSGTVLGSISRNSQLLRTLALLECDMHVDLVISRMLLKSKIQWSTAIFYHVW